MSLTVVSYGDVVRLRLTHWRSRLAGYEVSAWIYRGTLIDTGFPAVAPELATLAAERGVTRALLTHHHEDHSGGVAALHSVGIRVAMSELTRSALGTARPIAMYRRFVWGTPRPLPDARLQRDGPDVVLLPAPGHAADHHAVWDAERSTMFGGDLFLGVRVRVAHHAEDPRLQVETLRRVAALRPARFFDAHRGPIADPVHALLAKADWLEATIAAIDRRAGAGWSDRAIRRDVLGAEPLSRYVSGGEYSKSMLVSLVRRGTRETATRGRDVGGSD